jgi:hypothetical protein
MVNLVGNFSFESGTSGWFPTGNTSDVHTVVSSPYTAVDGISYLLKEFRDTGTGNYDSDPFPVTPGAAYSFGANIRWARNTPREVRIDIRWFDAGGAAIETRVGSSSTGGRVTATTTAWQEIVQLNTLAPSVATGAIADAVSAAIRIATLGVVNITAGTGEALAIDAVRANPGATLDAFGTLQWSFARFSRFGS